MTSKRKTPSPPENFKAEQTDPVVTVFSILNVRRIPNVNYFSRGRWHLRIAVKFSIFVQNNAHRLRISDSMVS